jgi:hypothetical protein
VAKQNDFDAAFVYSMLTLAKGTVAVFLVAKF